MNEFSFFNSYNIPELEGVRGIPTEPITFGPRNKADKKLLRNRDRDSVDFGEYILPALDFAKNAYSSFQYTKGVDDLLMDAGYSNLFINGVGYLHLNLASGMSDVRKENMQNIFKTAATGALIGLAFGPAVTAITAASGALVGGAGSIAGTEKAKEQISRANYVAANTNRVNLNTAMSQGMQIDFYKQYGNPESQVLHASDGVNSYTQTGNKNMKLTQSKYGPMFAPLNAFGKGGEVVGNLEDQRWDIIKGDGRDNKPLSMEAGDSVITDKFGLAEEAFPSVMAVKSINDTLDYILSKIDSQKSKKSKQVAENVAQASISKLEQERNMHNAKIGETLQALAMLKDAGYLKQEPVHAADGINFKKMGNSNLITGMAGVATGVAQFLQAHNSRIKRPYTYAVNPYETRAINDLYSLRTNVKPTIDAIDRESAAGRYRTATAGGLGSGLRILANVANILNTQNAKASAYMKAQELDNQYLSQAAQYAGNLGAQTAQRMQSANQWDLDYYSKAHAARQQGEQMGAYNILNAMQQYYANASKLGMYKDMRALYAADLDKDKQELLRKSNPKLYKDLFG